jgi:tRNA A-37 threonylcarbamoyl transferase component Bud32
MNFPRVGSEFAGYRLESVIARGGMSTVFLGEHLGLARKVAVKVLAQDLSEDDIFRERFVRESRIAAGLDHPNVIPIYEAGEIDGLLFIAMRYVQGPQLKDLIQKVGALPAERVLPIMSQSASALDAAHVRGLIHRDVKPGNILIDPDIGSEHMDHVYLCDFGLTKRMSSHSGLTRTGQFVGTIDYIAPEQIEGKDVDARTDIYSLGCVLYECLTGSVPFEKQTEAAVLWAHVQQHPEPVTQMNPRLPHEVEHVVETALAKLPEDRYQTCAELVGALRAAFAPHTVGGSEAAADREPIDPVMSGAARPEPGGSQAVASPPRPTNVEAGSGGGETRGSSAPAMPAGPSQAGPERPRRAGIALILALVFLAGAAIGGGTAYGLRSKDTSTVAALGSTPCTDIAGDPVTVGAPAAPLVEGTLTCLLSKHIPGDIRSKCHLGNGNVNSASAQLPADLRVEQLKADVFLNCSVPYSGTNFNLWYLFKHDRIDVADDYQAVLLANGFRGQGLKGSVFFVNDHQSSCVLASNIERRWWVVPEENGETVRHTFTKEPVSLGVPSTGRFGCWQDAEQHPWIAWTDANLPVLALAEATGAGFSRDLLSWWEQAAGPGHPPNA